jgi:quinoprotein glucose dehydrogenase
LWDYDLPSAPQLITVNRNGKKIDAVAVGTKHGFVFVFDRVTGEPVFPIEEKAFPQSEMPGEKSWPTQPIPSLPSFTRHEVTKENLNPYFSEEEKQKWYKRIDAAKSGLFVPPSDKYETIMMTGALGGASYGQTASNPQKGMLYLLSQDYGSVYKLSKVAPPRPALSAEEADKVKGFYEITCQSCHGKDMAGGLGPALVNAGQRLSYDEFKTTTTQGKGRMPGFVHVEESMLSALYRYMGGVPNRPNFARRAAPPAKKMEGPVVDSGGAEVPADTRQGIAMNDYPAGVARPEARYTTGYGTDWQALTAGPWASIFAYDLNTGTIKWKQPIGLDSAFSKGDKLNGAPAGAQKKGMVVTSTGVVFATGKGGIVYAFDADNGKLLWETRLGSETAGQPAMFTINGKEYLVVNATSNFARDSYNYSGKAARGYVVYALPEKKKRK